MKFLKLMIFLIFGLLITACASEEKPIDITATTWLLIELPGHADIPTPVTLSLADEKMSGSTTCSRYTTELELTGTAIKTPRTMRNTKNDCTAELMIFDYVYLTALGNVHAYKTDGNFLILVSDLGEIVFEPEQ